MIVPLVQGCLWAQMRSFDHIETHPGGREEVLDDISEDFPYLSVLSQHDRYHERTAPWHWHQELELFYVLEGTVDYATPHERMALPEGSVGMVNANVLHMTHATDGAPDVNLLIHMFRPQFLAERGSRVWRRCVEPLVSATSIELLFVTPGEGDCAGGFATACTGRSRPRWARGTGGSCACATIASSRRAVCSRTPRAPLRPWGR